MKFTSEKYTFGNLGKSNIDSIKGNGPLIYFESQLTDFWMMATLFALKMSFICLKNRTILFLFRKVWATKQKTTKKQGGTKTTTAMKQENKQKTRIFYQKGSICLYDD